MRYNFFDIKYTKKSKMKEKTVLVTDASAGEKSILKSVNASK